MIHPNTCSIHKNAKIVIITDGSVALMGDDPCLHASCVKGSISEDNHADFVSDLRLPTITGHSQVWLEQILRIIL